MPVAPRPASPSAAAPTQTRRPHGARRALALALVVGLLLGPTVSGGGPRAGAVALGATGQKLAVCSEGRAGIRWWATYRVQPADEAPALEITGVGGNRPASTSWTVWWDGPAMAEQNAVVQPHSLTVVPSASAHLLSPDHQCSLFLSASDSRRAVAVIGDSVFAGVAKQLEAHTLSNVGFAQHWLIGAISGFGWSASAPTWPASVVGGSWAIALARGFFAIHPSALVVELGANDALRALFTEGRRTWTRRVQDAVADNVVRLLRESVSAVPCTVLVTAPINPTSLFGAGYTYVAEAERMNAIIRSSVARLHSPRVKVADWAVVSAGHVGTVPSEPDWFQSDDLHPNVVGESALVDLVHRTLARCPRAT